ncbi:MAG: amidohydrolase [Thermomicrobiales bacterium]
MLGTGIAIINGKVAAVGTDADVAVWTKSGISEVDLKGRTVAPGINDAHCHPLYLGLGLTYIDASSPLNKNISEIVARVRERAVSASDGEWIEARGYDQARLDDQRHPTRGDLDPVSAANPVILVRACGHIGVANSIALQMADINSETPDPPGGTIDRDEHGEPTGVLREAALKLVQQIIPPPSLVQSKAALESAGNLFLSQGVTSVAEAGVRTITHMQAYEDLAAEGKLPVRTYLMMMIDETLDHLEALGIKTGFGDEWLRVGPAKLFLDGSIGGRTARMSEPYVGETDNYGLWMYDPDEIKAKMLRAHKADFQLCAHAIGDAAISLLLDAYEEALEKYPREDSRHRIEHCSIIDLDIVHRIKRIGAVPIPGTSFLYYFNNAYIQNLGWERIRYAYGMNTFYEHGIVAAASTDAPVVNTNPAIGLQTMMTRKSEEGEIMWKEESVPLVEALRAYTYNGAYASFEESIKGTLAPGMIGDAVVFETDISAVDAEEIGEVRVDMTIVDGHVVFDAMGLPSRCRSFAQGSLQI